MKQFARRAPRPLLRRTIVVSIGPSSISLITAALDLQLVRLLRAATADDAAMLTQARPSCQPPPEILPRRRIHPTPKFEPRPVVHPSPRFESRPVISPTPEEALLPPPQCVPDHAPCHGKLAIQPPWKVLPTEKPSQVAQPVKVVVHRPDIISKGSLIDLFI